MGKLTLDSDYTNWLSELKTKIRSTQIKAAIAVNSALIEFYWDLGRMIVEKQTAWGTNFLDRLSIDLKEEFPEMSGLSTTNLKYCRLFYSYFSIRPQVGDELKTVIRPQLGDELPKEVLGLPWGHIKLIINKITEEKEANFYIRQTIENNWSRDVLALQIKTNLYLRQGKAITNFKHTLPEPFSDLAQQTLKDPYIFDFMTLSVPYKEKDIEKQLINHVTHFLLELGKGFAFIGKQYRLEIADNEYFIDLLFYHVHLKCYVVIELKNTKFIPEYAGKLNFYLSAVDSLLKKEDDKPTIGILLCRDKNNIEAEFALRDINKPMGVSEFEFTEILPDNLKSSLPTVEELENELRILENE
jgi:predicted nuclease of restriction endonuclease-like (RecB) superfamily